LVTEKLELAFLRLKIGKSAFEGGSKQAEFFCKLCLGYHGGIDLLCHILQQGMAQASLPRLPLPQTQLSIERSH